MRADGEGTEKGARRTESVGTGVGRGADHRAVVGGVKLSQNGLEEKRQHSGHAARHRLQHLGHEAADVERSRLPALRLRQHNPPGNQQGARKVRGKLQVQPAAQENREV